MPFRSGILSSSLTYLLAGGRGQRLYPLTENRPKPLVPFGGIHRLIDFPLSNCLNSGLRRIAILAQHQCELVQSYLEAVVPRTPIHSDRGEFLECRCPSGGGMYRGTADAVFRNLDLVESTKPEFVVILPSDHVYRMDYRELLQFHAERGRALTIAAVECPQNAASQYGVLETTPEGDALSFEEKPREPSRLSSKPSRSLVSMGVYVFNARTLVELLTDDFSRNTSHDFGRDIVPRVVQRSRVSVYNFTESGVRLGAYWRDIGTADAYYHANMELLVNPLFDLYAEALWPMYGLEELVPRKKLVAKQRAACTVQDTIMSPKVALGRGSDVAHSVLSAGVKIARSATVRNAILLRNVRVGEGARIQRAILDDNVEIGDGVEIGYNPEKDREYGYLTEEGVVVIPAGARVAPSQLVTPTARWRTHLVTKKRVRSRT